MSFGSTDLGAGISISSTPVAVNNATADVGIFLMLGALRQAYVPLAAIRAGVYKQERGSAQRLMDLQATGSEMPPWVMTPIRRFWEFWAWAELDRCVGIEERMTTRS